MPTARPWRFASFAAACAALALAAFTLAAPPVTAERGRAAAVLDTVAPAEVGLSAERLERLDAGLQALVDDGRLAGVVALLARHGRIAFADVAGAQDVESGRPMARDSIFRIFSMTKPVTGVAMMMLYEEGKWRLNDPVSRHVPELAGLQVYAGEDDDGSMRLVDADHEMTMRELMTHTAGLGYVLDPGHPVNRLFLEKRVLNPLEPLSAMIGKLATVPLLAQPGTRWIYSAAVDVQGYLVEKLSGRPLAEFLDERIFEPLGMVDTGFHVPPSEVRRVALRHAAGEDGALVLDSRGDPFTSPPAGPSGGGGLYGTADDYLRFAQMLLDGGALDGVRLLAPRTVEMMRTNHLSAEATARMRPGMGFGMDFMIYVDPAAAGEPHAPGAYYWLGIDGTWFWIDPVLDFAFVGMIQHQGGSQHEVHGLSRNWVYQAIVD